MCIRDRSYAGGSKKGLPVGAPIPDYYPAAIDEATFQAAQKARRRNLATGRGRKGENFTNIFAGLTTCAYCGGKIKFHANGDSKSLICERVLEGTGCIRMAWSYKNFESSVLYFLIHPALLECFVGEQRAILVDQMCIRDRCSTPHCCHAPPPTTGPYPKPG